MSRSSLRFFFALATLGSLWLPAQTAGRPETGVHWAEPAEFVQLRNLGMQFVVTTVTSAPATWQRAFDAADIAGLRLIVGMNPSPYRLVDGRWTITQAGRDFLLYAARRSSTVKAIFVFNEPYWVDPFTGANDFCGIYSAEQLRQLNTLVRSVWPRAPIFHDIGSPSQWAPGGQVRRSYPCIGDKYADQRDVADFVGIWFYPFEANGVYRKVEALTALRREVDFVRNRMNAEPIVLNQSFLCTNCQEATRYPTPDEMRDWNCAARSLGATSYSWYVWRQNIYQDYLALHPESWPVLSDAACTTRSIELRGMVNSGSLRFGEPIAPGTIVSLYGEGFSTQTALATSGFLPRLLDGVVALVNGVAAPLFFTSPNQINFQTPMEVVPGEVFLQVRSGGLLSNAIRARVEDTSPGIFTITQNGTGEAVAVTAENYQLVSAANPARAGRYISVFCTGLGQLAEEIPTGIPVERPLVTRSPLTLSVGGRNAEVTYAGAAPGYPGLYQINFIVPAGLNSGLQTMQASIGGQQSNPTSLFVR
jgi:uncharacterized protein (TIGR03437 family)